MARPVPIQRQLRLGIVVAAGAAVLFLGIPFIVYDYRSFGRELSRLLSGEAEIVGLNSSAALLFRDTRAAGETLAALSTEPSVLAAAIYAADGTLFASYARSQPLALPRALPARPQAPGAAFERERLLVARPIAFGGERIGTVLIEASLAERSSRLVRQAAIVLATAGGAFLLATLIASRIQRGISGPIRSLARTAGQVSRTKDYSVRAESSELQEIAELVTTFNEMLFAIQRGEAELTALYTQAEQANRAKDQFLATLSHELRTPLNAIVGWASILNQGGCDEPTLEQGLSAIERNAKVQSKLIEDILDVSRIVSGKLHMNVGSVELPAVVGAAADALRHAAESKQIELRLELDARAGPVSGDADRLQQVFWNLISNAIKFTPRGGQVRVRLAREQGQVKLVVQDSGVGIEPAFLPHVFERFRQADASSTRRFGGLGLGLAIVRHLVELHGGSVEAASDGERRGATFTVSLPLAPPAPVQAALPAPAAVARVAAQLAARALDRVRVLVVDDDVDSLDVLTHALAQHGAEVETARSSADAMARFSKSPPDVLVSDIEMPGEDGYTLIRRIRSLPEEQGGFVPAAALTAYARSEDRVQALEQGFQIHLAKPVNPLELAVVVSSLAARSNRPRV